MSAMDQQIAGLQAELALSQQHVARLGVALDELRNESSAAIVSLRGTVEKLKDIKQDNKPRRLISTKNLEPRHFGGKDDEHYKEWAKSVKNFLNAQRLGFRKTLEWA